MRWYILEGHGEYIVEALKLTHAAVHTPLGNIKTAQKQYKPNARVYSNKANVIRVVKLRCQNVVGKYGMRLYRHNLRLISGPAVIATLGSSQCILLLMTVTTTTITIWS